MITAFDLPGVLGITPPVEVDLPLRGDSSKYLSLVLLPNNFALRIDLKNCMLLWLSDFIEFVFAKKNGEILKA